MFALNIKTKLLITLSLSIFFNNITFIASVNDDVRGIKNTTKNKSNIISSIFEFLNSEDFNIKEISFLENELMSKLENGINSYNNKASTINDIQDDKHVSSTLESIINISDYNYPLPENDAQQKEGLKYTIAIFATSDIHGSALKKESLHPGTNQIYSVGGLEFMSSELNALKEEWGNRLLWLDAGDQFQGGLETKISNGSIITDFFNAKHLDGTAIGNHEFDFGQEFLHERLNNSTFPYLATNIENDEHKKAFMNNTETSQVYKVGKIKVGVIGLSTLLTVKTTSGDLSNINFLDYIPSIIEESKKLRSVNNADIVIMTSHIGTICKNSDLNINKLRFFKSHVESECDLHDQEMNIILDELSKKEKEDGVVYLDAVIAGHTHTNTHHFIREKPVVSTINNGKYFNVIYLTFDIREKSNNSKNSNLRNINTNSNDSLFLSQSFHFNKTQSIIEGPVQVCDKVFQNTKTCSNVEDDDATIGLLSQYSYHNKTITADPKIRKIFSVWEEKLKPYEEVLATSEVRLRMNREGDSQLGNFFADCFRTFANADFSVVNSGNFRTEWSPGNITYINLYDMSPFTGKMYKFDIKGFEVKRLMSVIQKGSFRPYPISGLKVNIDSYYNPEGNDDYIITGSTLSDNKEIIDEDIYSMITNDFLIISYGDDFSLVKNWLKPDKLNFIGIDRDIIGECLKDAKHIKKDSNIDERIVIHKITTKN